MVETLTQERAASMARIALGHVTREYPHKLDHVLASDIDAQGPRALHPIFFGSFDWHSCVHGYWTLAVLWRRFPGMGPAAEIEALFARSLTPEKVAVERDYLARPTSRGFERPYGWAWLLKLQAELLALPDQTFGRALAPLAQAFAERFKTYLPMADYPVRNGSHGSTAFGLDLALDYAQAAGDSVLADLCGDKARAWYGEDRACQAWEPSGDDFLSPALIEATLMSRVLPRPDFRTWFDAFLPQAAQGLPATLFTPARVSDRSDGKIAHLDGLNLSRAWCWCRLAAGLPIDHPIAVIARASANLHLEASLPHLAGDYMGEHWLASFALLALTAMEA